MAFHLKPEVMSLLTVPTVITVKSNWKRKCRKTQSAKNDVIKMRRQERIGTDVKVGIFLFLTVFVILVTI